MTSEYVVKEYHKKNIIYKHLHLGTNLPVLDSFRKYIYREIDQMGCFSIVLKDSNSEEVLGHTMLFKWEDKLYFAFFYAKEVSFKNAKRLITEIESKARQLNCKMVLGPVNLPPYIYGFGFSEEGSDTSIFAMAPTTDPAYIDHFRKLDYQSPQKFLHFRAPLRPVPYEKKYDIRFADLRNPAEWKDKFLELQYRLYPSQIQITPNQAYLFDDILEFLNEFSNNDSVFLIYNDDGNLIGIGWGSPNPFDLNDNGKTRSYVLFGAAVEKEYQKQGILTEVFKLCGNHFTQQGVTYGEGFTNEENIASIRLFKSWGAEHTRTHVLMIKQI
ncbi:MAG: GNAT family N-acetyltransferase [Candidatus Lokiarchaeota archaeon]|nr:GNAT family N-acetyltransferase [Candidatus Lokiarchaeota archaeon]